MGRKRKTDRGDRDAAINDIQSNRDTILALGEKSIAIGTYQKIEQYYDPGQLQEIIRLQKQINEKIDLSRDVFTENSTSPFSDKFDDIFPFLQIPGSSSDPDVSFPKIEVLENTTIENITDTLEKFIGKEHSKAITKEAAKYVIYNRISLLLTDSIGAIDQDDWQHYTWEMATFSAKFADEQFHRLALMVQAYGHYSSNEHHKVLKITEQILTAVSMQNNLYLPLKYMEVASKVALGDTKDAEHKYRTLLSSDPTNFGIVYGLAATLGSQGRNREAIEILQSYKGKTIHDQEKIRLNYLLCMCMRRSGDTEAALILLDEIEEMYSEVETPSLKSRMLNLNGQIYLDLFLNSNDGDKNNSNLKKALPLFEQAIKVAKTMVIRGDELDDPTHNLGMVLFFQGHMNEALTKFEEAVNPKARRNAIPSIAMQAACKYHLGDHAGSEKLFQTTITEAKKCNAILQMAEAIQNYANYFPDADHSTMLSDFVMDYGESRLEIPAAIEPIFSMLLNHHLDRGEMSKVDFWSQYRSMKQF